MNELSKRLVKLIDVIAPVRIGLLSREVWGAPHVGNHVVYATIDAEFGGDGVLRGVSESGATIDEAISKLWDSLIDPPENLYIITNSFCTNRPRKAWRWDKEVSMWIQIEEELKS